MQSLINKGPRYTTTSVRTIKGEDHLGIRSVAISMADHLQSGITSITPRARYWAFFAWVLDDFIQHAHEAKTLINFKRFLKKQEGYFILANIADAEANGTTTLAVIGSTEGIKVWRTKFDTFEPFYNYVQESFGGYGTYRNVMKIMGLTMVGDEGIGVQIDRLTKLGIKLAEAFQQLIQNTEYYQKYRLTNDPVPREVIRQYGQAAALNGLKEAESKDYPLLTNIFLPEESINARHELRKHSMLYYMNIINQSNGNKLTFSYMQDLMFDGFYHHKLTVLKKLQTVAKGWEIYQARQFFTYSLDTIWSYLLNRMSRRILTMTELINSVLTELENSGYDLAEQVADINRYIPLTTEFRRSFIKQMRVEQKDVNLHVWQPTLVMLDVYHRLLGREDFEIIHDELLKLGGKDSISLKTWMEFVDSYQQKSIKDFISYILRYFILEQHHKVALNKMITTKNETYHFIDNDGKLYFISDDVPVFNTFRVNQGLDILEDLGLVKNIKGTYQVTSLGQVKLNGIY
ncbi:hypothetical protein [Peribacillus simplex]|uniref:hypothetical protein n=1 Tax=Peribacillus simplex TaxID=1478 RepID=UPI003D2D237F